MYKSKTNFLSVIVKDRQGVVFDGTAASVSSKNTLGTFDILSGHANFITLISGFLIVDKGKLSEKTITLEKGILSVYENAVTVYLGI
ncbi:hypothetical protein A3K34_00650 [candidate division WWE3 bacterium RIFOXYC1_FULL_40_10]|uniref:ATP synthase F1 complex delta/epsilon subunit N-terminal domain-containing protein n=1 Tax=candidate division WWE3 bacterium RIFOXYA2_FULL_46_9 TaxID=1802636 RepID=A0A1F4W3E0_UNCKA|nr:MAG: hypothetical protein A3K58_00650 [candidate division WWE3 bacterium RIFOXYB1_FULL_40_22]OGC61390.1 MAG: hypothetical protein A3K37_00650 [candidate division WWE3 bacterium RIFOXYA1_FULL_40_11]OGC63911.1 MAG: hypothetical protein A2264_02375 [candidate division WWE3 bacterium RIFOXYA2_FULL_46_9]OGC65380.1 MAG: hypothetical protein A2326_04935 [candidate division WWE3 bacterium RIFOXYB2_FULL_41_6]OGC65773.1 MAG: hypothetical protein A3K34_00650 [candidate division WWE3 bacterium RIFOXYC1_